MSMDRSLKIKGALERHRNVLSRGERIETLKAEERWSESDSVIGLAKVAHRKASSGKKDEVKPAAEAAAGTDTAAAAPASGKA